VKPDEQTRAPGPPPPSPPPPLKKHNKNFAHAQTQTHQHPHRHCASDKCARVCVRNELCQHDRLLAFSSNPLPLCAQQPTPRLLSVRLD
jgi:hypothetical protein